MTPRKRIALEFKHSRNTIRKILKHPQPNPTPRERNRTAPVLGPFQSIIDQILLDEEEAPPKQRHTAMQVFRRLQDEHRYHGCYGQVQRGSDPFLSAHAAIPVVVVSACLSR